MSTHLLGDHFDIHCGGVDNIFPHHENEVAQSRCLNPGPFVDRWLHSEHLIVDGQKMSKSLGNFYTLPDVLDRGVSAEAMRYTLLSTHYRQKLNFTFERAQESQKAVNRLRELHRRLETVPETQKGKDLPLPDKEVKAAMDDDLNIAGALGAIFKWAHRLFTALDEADLSCASAQHSLAALRRYDEFLGVIFFQPDTDLDIAAIESLVQDRELARKARNWQEADTIRTKILEMGISLEDTPTGTIWKRM